MAIKRKGNYWVDDKGNKWDIERYSKEVVENLSATLINCHNCTACSWCIDCTDCADCSNCTGCDGCYRCSNCTCCSSCDHCDGCRSCSSCSNCRDCRYCASFSKDPERIIGPTIGSRNDRPTVYWVEAGKEQCIVGCFRGTLNELKKAVEETHKNNPVYLTQYMKFIKGVRAYQRMIKRIKL